MVTKLYRDKVGGKYAWILRMHKVVSGDSSSEYTSTSTLLLDSSLPNKIFVNLQKFNNM